MTWKGHLAFLPCFSKALFRALLHPPCFVLLEHFNPSLGSLGRSRFSRVAGSSSYPPAVSSWLGLALVLLQTAFRNLRIGISPLRLKLLMSSALMSNPSPFAVDQGHASAPGWSTSRWLSIRQNRPQDPKHRPLRRRYLWRRRARDFIRFLYGVLQRICSRHNVPQVYTTRQYVMSFACCRLARQTSSAAQTRRRWNLFAGHWSPSYRLRKTGGKNYHGLFQHPGLLYPTASATC